MQTEKFRSSFIYFYFIITKCQIDWFCTLSGLTAILCFIVVICLLQYILMRVVELQNQNRDEIKKINLELSRVDASAGRLQDVDRDIRNTVRKPQVLLLANIVLLYICIFYVFSDVSVNIKD